MNEFSRVQRIATNARKAFESLDVGNAARADWYFSLIMDDASTERAKTICHAKAMIKTLAWLICAIVFGVMSIASCFVLMISAIDLIVGSITFVTLLIRVAILIILAILTAVCGCLAVAYGKDF